MAGNVSEEIMELFHVQAHVVVVVVIVILGASYSTSTVLTNAFHHPMHALLYHII